MEKFSRTFLDGIGEVDGFILKSRSPSCGINDTKQFGDEVGPWRAYLPVLDPRSAS